MKRDARLGTVFHSEFREDLRFWIGADGHTVIKVVDWVEAVMREHLAGPVKPEALRYYLAGCWSRRITQEHRLVCTVVEDRVEFLQARYHY